jgi:RNA polymerase sigma-70 factor (ECF subfamily)
MSDIRSPQAFAATVVTRLCLDRLKSARARREEYVGPWLPEPVLMTRREAPDDLAERSESVTMAFLVLLETLTAEERAVFLLKEVFDYRHAEIAGMLGTTASNSRQLFHRAKSKVHSGLDPMKFRTGDSKDREARQSIATRFAGAFRSGNAAELTQLLRSDVTFVADGGGKVAAARKPLAGRDAVLHLLLGLQRSAIASGIAAQAALDVMEVNREPAVVLRIAGQLDGVFILSIAEGVISGIRVVRNPDKLVYFKRQLEAS